MAGQERMVKLNVERAECLMRMPEEKDKITDLMRPDPKNYDPEKCDKACTFANLCRPKKG